MALFKLRRTRSDPSDIGPPPRTGVTMVIAPGTPETLPDPADSISEFDLADGSRVSLRDYTCSRVTFDVLTKQVELTFNWDASDPQAACVCLTFDDAEIYAWEDDPDLPGQISDELLPAIRGQVTDFFFDHGAFHVLLLNVSFSILASNCTATASRPT